MKLSVGSVLALVTLIGSILIGGANFGELRSTTINNRTLIYEQNEQLRIMKKELIESRLELLHAMTKISTDIEWLKLKSQ